MKRRRYEWLIRPCITRETRVSSLVVDSGTCYHPLQEGKKKEKKGFTSIQMLHTHLNVHVYVSVCHILASVISNFFEWSPPTDIPSDIYSDILCGILSSILSDLDADIYLVFYMAFFLTFYLTYTPTFYLASCLTFYLAYVLAFILAFYLPRPRLTWGWNPQWRQAGRRRS